jgi:dolichol-phosphate mannosyltransferase
MTARPLVITGASGFVGARLCQHFAAQGRRVIAVEGTSRRKWRLADARAQDFETRAVDLADQARVQEFIREAQPEVWINCAAYGAYSVQSDAARIYRVNFEAVRWMLDALGQVNGFRAFIQAGSSSEYGLNCSGPSEDAPTRPDSDYAVSKVAATALTQYYGLKKGVPAWVFRLYSVYGPYEDTSRLIPKLVLAAHEGRLPPLANPEISRDFVYVDDVCRAFDALIARADATPRGEVFNIGSGRKTTLRDLVEVARDTLGIDAQPDWGSMADRKWDHADWFANPAKAAQVLGWQATTGLADGLRLTSEWMKKNPELVKEAIQNDVTIG